MKSLIICILLFLLSTGITNASPFLVCDPQTGVEYYEITGWTVPTVTAQTDGSLRMDIASAVVGTTPLTIKACNLWECSVAVPFDLIREPAISVPQRLKLVK